MNEKAKAASAASLAGLFILFASHGEAFFRGALGAWKFLEAITSGATLGIGAFFWGIAFSTLIALAYRRLVPEGRNKHSRALMEQIMCVIVSVHVGWLQMPNRNGIMIGLLAGLSAPLLTRVILAVSTWIGISKWDRQAQQQSPPAPSPPDVTHGGE